MRLTMLSWRYVGHPQAGGAEVLTHEILRRMVDRGWSVTCFTAAHDGVPMHDEIDGVRLVRRGQQHTVHAQAYRWLRSRLDATDRVVDQVNTIPFLTPLYVPKDKRRLFVCQLAREYWFRETRGAFKLVAPIGYAAEPAQFQLYRGTPAVTISRSSEQDLRRLGLRDVAVIPMAIDTAPVAAVGPRTGPLRLVILGRLTPAKFVEEGIRAFGLVQRERPDAVLDVVGSGDPAYRAALEANIAAQGIRGVTFHGRVSLERKRELLESAWVHVFTSHREGWGLTVTEAGAVGTPSVGYDAPGVRDSIGEPRSLAPIADTETLARRILSLVSDPQRFDAVRTAAWERARALSWERTSEEFEEAVR